MERGDEEALLAFLERMMRPLTLRVTASSRYRWLYRENPHGTAITLLGFESEGDEIIACVSQFPRKMWLKDRVILASVGGDMWVDPRFRRFGIATELQGVIMREMREAGIHFRYSTATPAMLRIKRRTGADIVGDIRKMHFLLKSQPVVSRILRDIGPGVRWSGLIDEVLNVYVKGKLSKFASARGQIRQISHFDNRYDDLAKRIISSFGVCGVRDSAFLNWRHFKNPAKNLTVLGCEEGDDVHGFAAIELSGKRCYLVDLFVRRDDELVENLICGAIRFAISMGSDLITSMMNPGGPYFRNLRRMGFRLDTTRLPLPINLAEDAGGREYLARLENWHLTFADYDVESMA